MSNPEIKEHKEKKRKFKLEESPNEATKKTKK